MLHSFEITPLGHANGSPSESEFTVIQSKAAKKRAAQKKNGHESIDATDERDEAQRLNEGLKESFDEDWN